MRKKVREKKMPFGFDSVIIILLAVLDRLTRPAPLRAPLIGFLYFCFIFFFFSLAVAVAAIIVSVRTITIGAVPIDAGFSALQLVPLRAFSHGPRRRPRRFRPWESASSSARLAFRWEMSPFLLKKKCSFPPFFRLTPKTDFCLFHRWELDGSSPDSERVGPLFWNSNSGFRSLRANFRRVK